MEQDLLTKMPTEHLRTLSGEVAKSIESLREIQDRIAMVLLERAGKTLPDSLPTEVRKALREGRRIRAIKEMRRHVSSLREARDIVYAALAKMEKEA